MKITTLRYYSELEVPEFYRHFTTLLVLDMTIHGAPHKRQHRRVLQVYRDDLYDHANRRLSNQIQLPIEWPIALKVLFTNPNSPDLDHLIEAVYMAVDGSKGSLTGPGILADDRLIQSIWASKIYSTAPTRRDSPDR